MDPYCVHDAGINRSDKTVFRTFVKVSISKTKYCKLGNAKNPLFQYEWNMIPRHGVPYSKPILAQSSLRRDRDAFKDVDPTEIDFMGSDCNVAWAESRIHNCYRSQPVRAAPAEEGEMLGSCHDDFLITVNVAQAGDWKITPKYGDEYFLPAQKLQANYERSEDDEELFLPKKTLRRCVKLSEDITFKAPWGTRSFAKAGDYLVYLNDADIYPIPKDVFEHEHTLCR